MGDTTIQPHYIVVSRVVARLCWTSSNSLQLLRIQHDLALLTPFTNYKGIVVGSTLAGLVAS